MRPMYSMFRRRTLEGFSRKVGFSLFASLPANADARSGNCFPGPDEKLPDRPSAWETPEHPARCLTNETAGWLKRPLRREHLRSAGLRLATSFPIVPIECGGRSGVYVIKGCWKDGADTFLASEETGQSFVAETMDAAFVGSARSAKALLGAVSRRAYGVGDGMTVCPFRAPRSG